MGYIIAIAVFIAIVLAGLGSTPKNTQTNTYSPAQTQSNLNLGGRQASDEAELDNVDLDLLEQELNELDLDSLDF